MKSSKKRRNKGTRALGTKRARKPRSGMMERCCLAKTQRSVRSSRAGQDRQTGDEGEEHPPGQRNPEIRAQSVPHGRQGQEPEDRGDGAGHDRRGGLADGDHHRLFLGDAARPFLAIPFPEEDAKIQGNAELQRGSHGIGQIGDTEAEKEVDAQVGHDGEPECQEEQERHNRRGNRQKQDHQDQDQGDQEHSWFLDVGKTPHLRQRHGLPGQFHPRVQEGLDAIDGPPCLHGRPGIGENTICRAVALPRKNCRRMFGSRVLPRHGDVRQIVDPGDRPDAGDGGHALLEPLDFPVLPVLDQQESRRPIAELVVQDPLADGRGGIGRQVAHEVVLDQLPTQAVKAWEEYEQGPDQDL